MLQAKGVYILKNIHTSWKEAWKWTKPECLFW